MVIPQNSVRPAVASIADSDLQTSNLPDSRTRWAAWSDAPSIVTGTNYSRAAATTLDPVIDPTVDIAGNILSAALNISTLTHLQTQSYTDWVGLSDSTDYYTFTLAGQSNFSLDLQGLAANADVELINSSGQILSQSNLPGSVSEAIAINGLQAGQYYVRVATVEGGTTYRLNLNTSYTRIDGTVQNRGEFPWNGIETESINIRIPDGSTRQQVEDTETWIVIHGHRSDPSGFIGDLANAILPNHQVLVLDWSEPADNSFIRPDRSASWIHQVAEFATQAVSNIWGITSSNLNLIGHSLGSYLASEIAAIIAGPQRQNPQVDQIIALDPARWLTPDGYDINGLEAGFQPASEFDEVSTISTAFWGEGLPLPGGGEGLGSARYAHSADQSFRIEFEDSNDAIANHNAIVTLFTNLLNNPNGSIARLFQLDALQSPTWGLVDGDEGLLRVNAQNQPDTLYFVTVPNTWIGAQAQAIAAGGNLVSINNATEQARLESTFDLDQRLWIGLTDSSLYGATEGRFRWVNGEPLTYTRWRANEPNNAPYTAEGEDFVALYPNGRWNDLPGESFIYRGIVEIA